MRTKKSTLIDVGIFVTIGLTLALIAVFFIGRERSLFEPRYTLIAAFKDISGLRSGAVVQLAGLNAGYVAGVRFPKDKASENLEVLLKVSRDYKDRIRKDSVASIHTQGLLGDKYIYITTGSESFEPLEDNSYIPTQEISTIQNLTEESGKAMAEIHRAAKKMADTLEALNWDKKDAAILKKTLANLETTTHNLNTITEKIKSGEGTIGALVMDPSLYNDMRALMGQANRNKLLKNLIRATIAEEEKPTGRPIQKEK